MEDSVENRSSGNVEIKGEEGKEVTFFFSGRISLETISKITGELRSLINNMSPSRVIFDLSSIEYVDSAGALSLLELERECLDNEIPVEMDNIPEEGKRIFSLIDRDVLRTAPIVTERKGGNYFQRIGEAFLVNVEDGLAILEFMGDLLRAILSTIPHPRRIRWKEVYHYMKVAGVDGLPIVSLISLLLGLIIAFMSAIQLKQFGANIYVASLVGVAMVRELGPIMTAILVAGRSGSAFAAEIGTMRVNEEVDALVTMGYEPVHFLALPKVIASMVVVPLLTLYADLMGILGGMIIGCTSLDLTVYSYIQETQKTLTLFSFGVSMVKSAVFAAVIAGIGCQRGFQVRGGAQAVGRATTSAVVVGIFLIIVIDSTFAVVLQYI